MLKLLPTDDELYALLAARDASLDGQVFACVSSTGIFCRLDCPARTPLRQNVEFRGSVAACLTDGFRPCKRCHPLAPRHDAALIELIRGLEADPTRRWGAEDLRALGHVPPTVERACVRTLGVGFLELARMRRALVRGEGDAAKARTAIDAVMDSGSEGLSARWIETPLGPMLAVAGATALHLLEFASTTRLIPEVAALKKATGQSVRFADSPVLDQLQDQLVAYFAGVGQGFELPLAGAGTPFQRRVWDMLCTIPPGTTWSYAALARSLGQPSATRAVAAANGANPISILVPCHRVIGADGSLTGYGGGLWRKRWLLTHEGAQFS